jgi:hypothetical protein
MVQKLAYTVKCTLDDPHFYENSILHLAIWDSNHSTRKGKLEHLFVGEAAL